MDKKLYVIEEANDFTFTRKVNDLLDHGFLLCSSWCGPTNDTQTKPRSSWRAILAMPEVVAPQASVSQVSDQK